MYQLLVFHAGDTTPRARFTVDTATDVLKRIPEILDEHGTCERVVVMLGVTRLFSVDCAGNRLP